MTNKIKECCKGKGDNFIKTSRLPNGTLFIECLYCGSKVGNIEDDNETINLWNSICDEKNIITNREWLNSLSDEEFAEYGYDYWCGNEINCKKFKTCYECRLDWLQAEHTEV